VTSKRRCAFRAALDPAEPINIAVVRRAEFVLETECCRYRPSKAARRGRAAAGYSCKRAVGGTPRSLKRRQTQSADKIPMTATTTSNSINVKRAFSWPLATTRDKTPVISRRGLIVNSDPHAVAGSRVTSLQFESRGAFERGKFQPSRSDERTTHFQSPSRNVR
jgi:hypothetical protein